MIPLSELRKRIGATISYKVGDSLLGFSRQALLLEVRGKNLRTDTGDWLWYPDLSEVQVVREPETPVRKTRKKPT
jgi:hypothetical protein